MSEPQPITIHDARREPVGEYWQQLWLQLSPDGPWQCGPKLCANAEMDKEHPKAVPVCITSLEVESLRQELAKCRENFAEHTGAEFPAGRCGARPHLLAPTSPQYACELPAGHAGWHKDRGAEWTPEPGSQTVEAVRVGLDVDQEIRARALDAAVRAADWIGRQQDPADAADALAEVAIVFADLIRDGIRDGGVPDAG